MNIHVETHKIYISMGKGKGVGRKCAKDRDPTRESVSLHLVQALLKASGDILL